jgi:hypothetical protein
MNRPLPGLDPHCEVGCLADDRWGDLASYLSGYRLER